MYTNKTQDSGITYDFYIFFLIYDLDFKNRNALFFL